MRTIAFLRRFVLGRSRLPVRAKALRWHPSMRAVFHDVPPRLEDRFQNAGYPSRLFFPHQIRCLPKCGPDGLKLAQSMCDAGGPDDLWQIVLHATRPAIDQFPDDLFFDSDLLWHQQQFNRVGQIASATLVAKGPILFTLVHQSDLVQRMSRLRTYKTRVEKVFKGWHHLLLNAIASVAVEHGFREIRVPTSRLAMEHTDRRRTVQPELFDRVYDRAVHHHFGATPVGRWWSIRPAANPTVVVNPERREEDSHVGKTICVCHDVERGIGHRNIDPEFARRADAEAPAALDRMLAVERAAGVQATYNVVGSMLSEVRERIEGEGHALAFHSYDHDLGRDQLGACRRVDYRLKGYRAPQSRLTSELRDARLCWHNFEWLASSASSLGFSEPRLEHRLVRFPILFDDFEMHQKGWRFEEWRRRALEVIRQHDFIAFSLHDCYAAHWLPHYEAFLHEIKAMARLQTLDQVAGDLFVAGGV
jgi:hypothetical protein